MKSLCTCCVLTPTKTSEPILLLSPLSIWTSCGLNKDAALCSSAEHCPSVLRSANSAGTQPSGPVPVTRTLRAPRSYSFWNHIKYFMRYIWSYIYILTETVEYIMCACKSRKVCTWRIFWYSEMRYLT